MNSRISWAGALEKIRRTYTAKGREVTGTYSIEGIRLHERAIRAGQQIELSVVSENFADRDDQRSRVLLQSLETAGTKLVIVPDEEIKKLTGGRDLGAILGLVIMPKPQPFAEFIRDETGDDKVFTAMIDVQDPGNVGAIMRTNHAGGASGIFAVGISDPYHPKAVRTSMGSVFKVPLFRYVNYDQFAHDMMEQQIMTLATVVKGGLPLPDVKLPGVNMALLVGSEAWGLSQKVLEAVDKKVTIPMPEGVDSYSVNAATAIILYVLQKQ